MKETRTKISLAICCTSLICTVLSGALWWLTNAINKPYPNQGWPIFFASMFIFFALLVGLSLACLIIAFIKARK